MSYVALTLALAVAAQAGGTPCDMSPGFDQPDQGGATTLAVWQDAGLQGLLFGDVLHVNTDGTRRSYDVGDFWGKTRAVNNLCNAMSDGCAGLNEDELTARRVLTQQARADGWPAAAPAKTKLSPSIIPMKNGKPCPEVGGYLVSATALHVAKIKDVCDLASYVDAMAVPALVLPKRLKKEQPTPFEARKAGLGDLAVVVSADGKRRVFAVVGDKGPAKELGEGSIALTGALLGKTAEPANYREVRGKPPYAGKGWDAKGLVLIFPGSADPNAPYLTKARIDAAAGALLETWGGAARLEACRGVYKPK
jgi:hypothetical protein